MFVIGHTLLDIPVAVPGCQPNDLKTAVGRCGWGLNEDWTPEEFSAGHSPIIWRSVYVLVTLALGKHWVIDGSADPKGKLQLTIF